MKINIAHITLSMGMGGLENLIVNLVQQADKEMYSITVVCLDKGGDLLNHIHGFGHDSIVIGRRPGFDLGLIFKLIKLFKKKHIHIVHAHNQAALFYSGIAAKLARVPLIMITEHSRHNMDLFFRRKIEKRILYSLADHWVVVSNELRHMAIHADGLPPKKITVINNGIDLERFQSSKNRDDKIAIKRMLNLPDLSFIIIMVARLDPIKNHALMLKSFALIKNKIPHAKLLLVGDGECRNDLETLAQQLSIENDIRFIGNRNDIPDLLSISNLFVLCSKSEGLPISLLEACAADVPVLITKPANRAGFIKNGINGFTIECDEFSIASEINYIYSIYYKVKLITKENKSILENNFSIKSIANKYDLIYQKKLCPFLKKKHY